MGAQRTHGATSAPAVAAIVTNLANYEIMLPKCYNFRSSVLRLVLSYMAVAFLACPVGGSVSRRRALLMDEVDGMAGNEDRGGVQELISLLKATRVPIICMCNDRQHPKIRSLANHCFDLRFHRPRIEQIRVRYCPALFNIFYYIRDIIFPGLFIYFLTLQHTY